MIAWCLVAGCDRTQGPATTDDLMEDLGRSFEYLDRHLDQEDAAAPLLDHVAQMRKLAGEAARTPPDQVAEAGEADRAGLAAAYQEHLAALGPPLDELEAAIRAGDRAAARTALDKLGVAQQAGHEALGVE